MKKNKLNEEYTIRLKNTEWDAMMGARIGDTMTRRARRRNRFAVFAIGLIAVGGVIGANFWQDANEQENLTAMLDDTTSYTLVSQLVE